MVDMVNYLWVIYGLSMVNHRCVHCYLWLRLSMVIYFYWFQVLGLIMVDDG